MKYDDSEQKVLSLIQHEIQLETLKTPNMNIMLISKKSHALLRFQCKILVLFVRDHVTYITIFMTAYSLLYSVYYTS